MSSNIHQGKSWQHSNSLERYESMFCKAYLRKLEQMKSLTFMLYKAIKGDAIRAKATVLNPIFSRLNLTDNCRNLAVLCMSCQLNFSVAWQFSELNISVWTFSILFSASLSVMGSSKPRSRLQGPKLAAPRYLPSLSAGVSQNLFYRNFRQTTYKVTYRKLLS